MIELARPGVEKNLAWLHQQYSERLLVQIADTRNRDHLQRAVTDAAAVLSLRIS